METNIVREFDKKISDETIVNIPRKKTYDEIIDELEEENENLASNMPWNTTEQATEISVDDAAKYSRNKLELFGKTEQDNTKMTYKCDGTETGDYYLTYDSTDYYFTMPTITEGDILVFNTANLKLYLGDTEITTESTGTGTNLTFISSPNPDYPQDIHVFKGSNIIHTENKDYPIDIPDGIEMHRIKNYAYEIFKNERSNIYYDASLIEDRWYYRYRIRTFKLIPGVFSRLSTNANYTVYQTRHFENLYDGRYKGKTTYCTHFKGEEANYVYDISTNNSYNICGVAEQNKLRIKVKTADFPTVSDFNSFLENNNVELVSISATPIITLIEDETFVAQVEKIYEHLQLVKGTNNITVTAEDLAPYMQLTYMQDLPAKLDKLEAMVIENS